MAKRAGRVGFGSGQSGRGLKRVIFKRINRVTGQTGLTRFAMSTTTQQKYSTIHKKAITYFQNYVQKVKSITNPEDATSSFIELQNKVTK